MSVSFLNQKPADLGVKVNAKTPGTGYVDVDLNMSMTHPIPGNSGFDGYDVRGVFIGHGSGSLLYKTPKLRHSVEGADQFMMKDPNATADVEGGAPDGYTRWFNPSEFTTAGLFGYVEGRLASKNYFATATLNPYKYFADGLASDEGAIKFLNSTTGNGVFSSGSTNTRRYYIRFPTPDPGLKFSYAIIADWKGTKPEDQPANAPEAVAASVDVADSIYFNSPTDFGGNLTLDIGVFDWNSALTNSTAMTDYTILLDSTVLKSVHTATSAEMTPTSSGPHYYIYHFSIPAEQVSGLTNNGVWAIIQYTGKDYTNPAKVPNGADRPAGGVLQTRSAGESGDSTEFRCLSNVEFHV